MAQLMLSTKVSTWKWTVTPSIRQGGDGENRELKGSKANGNRGLGDSVDEGWGWCEDSDCIVEFEGWMDDFIAEK